jgi:hypothetical protein
MKKNATILFSIIVLTSCVKYKQNKGMISPITDQESLSFTTSRSLVVLPIVLEGNTKYFILDNGDELTTINRKEFKGRVNKVNTATGGKAKTGNEVVRSMKLGNVEFKNICAKNLNFEYVEKEIPNYGGLIGQSVLSKANWMIDYPNKKISLTTKDLNTDGFETIPVKKLRDPKINVVIDGETYSAFVDLGSSTAFAVVESSPLGQKLLQKITFVEGSKETFTAEGVKTSIVKRGILPLVKVGNVEIKNIDMLMGKTSSNDIRIGMAFFKDCKLYLDYTNGSFKIKKTN